MKINAKLMPLLVICLVLAFSLELLPPEKNCPSPILTTTGAKTPSWKCIPTASSTVMKTAPTARITPSPGGIRRHVVSGVEHRYHHGLRGGQQGTAFQDVPQGHWAYDIIAELYPSGHHQRCLETSFDPSSPIKQGRYGEVDLRSQ